MNNATQCERDIFPFQSLSDSDLIHLSFNSNTDCLCSDQISKTKLSLLPRFDNVAAVSKVPHLSDLDADQNFPSQSNFKYYSVHDFHVVEDIFIYLILLIIPLNFRAREHAKFVFLVYAFNSIDSRQQHFIYSYR